PWSADPSALERLERWFRRARTLTDQLASEPPHDHKIALARVHVYAKLGVALQRLDRSDEAEAAYRQAIAVEDQEIDRVPDDVPLRIARAMTREALAKLLLDRGGRRDDARAVLEAAADELRSLADGRRPPPRERYESLADAFRKLDEPSRAD